MGSNGVGSTIDSIVTQQQGGIGAVGGSVFMGLDPVPPVKVPYALTPNFNSYAEAVAAGEAQYKSRRKVMPYTEALGVYDQWTDKQQQDFLAKLKVAGLVQADAGTIEAHSVWEKLVDEAMRKTAAGRDISPMDILSGYVKAAGGMQKGQWQKSADGKWEVNLITGERRYIGPRFVTTTDQLTDFTDPATARAIATKMFQDMMGRDPGKGELSAFGSALSQAESANPTIATTTTEYNNAGEAIGTNTTKSGGVSAEGKALLAEDQIKKKPEFGATQAATTYRNAFEDAVYGAPTLG